MDVAQLGGAAGERGGQRYRLGSANGRRVLVGFVLTNLAERPPMHLVLDHGGHEDAPLLLDVGRELVRMRLVGEVGQPAAGIEDDLAHFSR